jgi:hypothetical protein
MVGGAQAMYTSVSKCKNDKIKRERKNKIKHTPFGINHTNISYEV